MVGAIIFIAICIGIILLGISGMKKQKEAKKLQESKKQELGISKTFDAGKYITGHSKITTPNLDVQMYFKDDIIFIIDNSPNLKELGQIPLKEVTNVSVEDASTVEKRITATRLLTIGIFAFAAKKNEKKEMYYLTINWKDGKFDQETIFEFNFKPNVPKNQQNLLKSANILKSEIMNQANSIMV